jgi:hypothetical protein
MTGKRTPLAPLLAAAIFLAPPPALANPVIYPARAQSAQQQDRDRYECYEWARGQSGFDPAQAARPASNPQAGMSGVPNGQAGAMAGGALRGAALAEVTNHDVGRGAAKGVLFSGMRERGRKQQAAQAQQKASQEQAMRDQYRSTYERALGACMEARGYTVW